MTRSSKIDNSDDMLNVNIIMCKRTLKKETENKIETETKKIVINNFYDRVTLSRCNN